MILARLMFRLVPIFIVLINRVFSTHLPATSAAPPVCGVFLFN